MSWRAISWARKRRVGSSIPKAVLMDLALHADDKGFCWPSQETMAAEIECSVDSVQRALKRLERSGLLSRIKRKSSDGRRISDAYQLNLNSRQDNESHHCGPAPCGLVDDGHQAAGDTRTEPQTDVPPDGTERPKYSKEIIQESSCCLLRDTPGGARLEKRLGKAEFNAWFAKVAFVEERDQLLVLQAPNRHIADKIGHWFDPDIVRCFQPEYKEAVRVKVIIQKNVPSSEGGLKTLASKSPDQRPSGGFFSAEKRSNLFFLRSFSDENEKASRNPGGEGETDEWGGR